LLIESDVARAFLLLITQVQVHIIPIAVKSREWFKQLQANPVVGWRRWLWNRQNQSEFCCATFCCHHYDHICL